ncbi:uncharacterized protein PODANS_0_450 [Podospora anserina S mat+]|uniref:Podospora anserina S mat+ genomic DNA chromosome 4, supercontig 2 n=1 Tax=Podospora anserina (strain S / ATCC MYA-4624 / DSM 980 / FGSC 10383) TaxID=515849 RepID=B2ADX8_PODAN|nr:uncharacterized protein PODANS_0_450 [Podospora anserina S mat+]CAP61643.1 unnamed protein product [Podospora anserina S mat+]CDP27996.1 Putative protein of unknown function [Podospora anserina S mat+]
MHGNSLRMYTSAMSWDHQSWTSANSLAISSTYIEASKLTVAVIFGCSEQQMARVEELLASCPGVKSHPLLTVGIFAELHKDRMQEIVKKAIYECTAAITDLKLDRDAPPLVKRDFKLNRKLRNWRLKTKMAEEVRTTKGLLQKMITQVEEEQQLQSFQYDGEFATSTRRFKQRFTEIEIELDALMARCRMMFDDMTYSEELFMNELLSDDAERARDQAKMSTVIAFVAMLYLPITAVATIFAMPVFDFQNERRDIYFRKAETGEDSDQPPVLSSYFWVYLIVSVVLTGFTVFGWWHYARGTSKAHNRRKALKRMRRAHATTGGWNNS